MQRLPGILVFGCSGALPRGVQAADGSRPNVLFTAIDDLNRWVGHLGAHAQAYLATIALCDTQVGRLLEGLEPSTWLPKMNAPNLPRAGKSEADPKKVPKGKTAGRSVIVGEADEIKDK